MRLALTFLGIQSSQQLGLARGGFGAQGGFAPVHLLGGLRLPRAHPPAKLLSRLRQFARQRPNLFLAFRVHLLERERVGRLGVGEGTREPGCFGPGGVAGGRRRVAGGARGAELRTHRLAISSGSLSLSPGVGDGVVAPSRRGRGSLSLLLRRASHLRELDFESFASFELCQRRGLERVGYFLEFPVARRRRRRLAHHPRVVPLHLAEALGEPRRALALGVAFHPRVDPAGPVLDVELRVFPRERVQPERRDFQLRGHDIRLPRERAQLALRGVRAPRLRVARVQSRAFTLRRFPRAHRGVRGRHPGRLRVPSHRVDVEVEFRVLLILPPPLVLELRELHVPVREQGLEIGDATCERRHRRGVGVGRRVRGGRRRRILPRRRVATSRRVLGPSSTAPRFPRLRWVFSSFPSSGRAR